MELGSVLGVFWTSLKQEALLTGLDITEDVWVFNGGKIKIYCTSNRQREAHSFCLWFGQGRRSISQTGGVMSWQRGNSHGSSHRLLPAAIAHGILSLQCLTLFHTSNRTASLAAQVLLCWWSFLGGTGAPCEQLLCLWLVLDVALGGEAALLRQKWWNGVWEEIGERVKTYHRRPLLC